MSRSNQVVLLFLVLVQVGGWIFLTLLSRGQWSDGFAYEVDNDAMPTWIYVLVQAGMGVSLIATFLFLKSRKVRYFGWGIFVIAGVLRLIAMMGEPIHESDFYRYLWDGKVAEQGINPYRFEPGALFLQERGIEFEFPDRDTEVTWRGRLFDAEELEVIERLKALRDENLTLFQRVSHPAVTTIYPPFAQMIFYLSERLFGDSVMGMKLLFVGFDMGVVLLIQLVLTQLKKFWGWGLLYAWNPLPIKEFANSAHYDAVAVFFVLLAIWLTLREGGRAKKVFGVALALALGTLTKYFAVLLLPVLLFAIFRSDDDSLLRESFPSRIKRALKAPEVWWGSAVFSAVCVLGFCPYLLWDEAGFAEVFRGLGSYNEHWVYSPGLFSLIRVGVGWFFDETMMVAKLISGLLLTSVVLWVGLWSKETVGTRCFVVMAGLFILIPTAYPWYFCWVLALVPFQKRFSWLALGLLLPLNYVDFHSLGNTALSQLTWSGFYATQILVWGGFLLCWFTERTLDRRHV